MRPIGTMIRVILMVMLILLAALIALASLGAYASLAEERAYMRMNAEHFRAVGMFATDYRQRRGKFPTEKQLQDWSKREGYDREWYSSIGGDRVGGNSVACSKFQPEYDFAPPTTDVFVLHRWRGEFFDCYSLPSGASNVIRPLRGDSIIYHIICWLLVSGFLACVWLLRPKKPSAAPS